MFRAATTYSDRISATDSASGPATASTTRRTSLRARAAALGQQEIAFIFDPSFPEANGGDPEFEAESDAGGTAGQAGELLTADNERRLFKRMNWLKYRANILRSALDADRPSRAKVQELERLLDAARQVRDRLIAANLRLVVSIAKRFVDPSATLDELISDGNLTLMHAVEKFDAGRGFRFSTYATHAIQRCYYARLRRRSKLPRLTQAAEAFMDQVADNEEPEDSQEQRTRLAQLAALLSERLDPRERLVLQARFGLDEESGPQTLRSIGHRLKLSKERIRQLQIQALKTLQEVAALA